MRDTNKKNIVRNNVGACHQNLSSEDFEILKTEFYSENDIFEIERNFENIRFSISFFDNDCPENNSKKYVTIAEARNMLAQKDFLLAAASAVLEQHHYSVCRINVPIGVKYLTAFL